MKAWWPLTPAPANLGDYLTFWMAARDGVALEHVSQAQPGKLLGIGSIARFAKPGDHVWTSGIMRRGQVGSPDAHYHAVRGPLTADALGLRGKVPLGDGALCLPRYFDPRAYDDSARRQTHDVGIIPHYVDMNHADEWPAEWLGDFGTKLIPTLTTDVEGFVRDVLACRRIESSSLHGCIVAQAYGVPWRWVRLGDRLTGDDSKFADFFATVAEGYSVDDLMSVRPWL